MSRNVSADAVNPNWGPRPVGLGGGHCAIGIVFLQWNSASNKTGNAHPQVIKNITNQVQRTPRTYPVQVTIRPIRMIAREAKPMGG
jgi:hypothetical protein